MVGNNEGHHVKGSKGASPGFGLGPKCGGSYSRTIAQGSGSWGQYDVSQAFDLPGASGGGGETMCLLVSEEIRSWLCFV